MDRLQWHIKALGDIWKILTALWHSLMQLSQLCQILRWQICKIWLCTEKIAIRQWDKQTLRRNWLQGNDDGGSDSIWNLQVTFAYLISAYSWVSCLFYTLRVGWHRLHCIILNISLICLIAFWPLSAQVISSELLHRNALNVSFENVFRFYQRTLLYHSTDEWFLITSHRNMVLRKLCTSAF